MSLEEDIQELRQDIAGLKDLIYERVIGNRILGTKEFAERAGVTPWTIREKIKRGLIIPEYGGANTNYGIPESELYRLQDKKLNDKQLKTKLKPNAGAVLNRKPPSHSAAPVG